MHEKTCTRCLVAKPLDQFHKRAASRDGVQPYCKPCGLMLAATTRSDPDYKERERAVMRATKRAMVRLAQIHPDEYAELRAKELVTEGVELVRPRMTRTQ